MDDSKRIRLEIKEETANLVKEDGTSNVNPGGCDVDLNRKIKTEMKQEQSDYVDAVGMKLDNADADIEDSNLKVKKPRPFDNLKTYCLEKRIPEPTYEENEEDCTVKCKVDGRTYIAKGKRGLRKPIGVRLNGSKYVAANMAQHGLFCTETDLAAARGEEPYFTEEKLIPMVKQIVPDFKVDIKQQDLENSSKTMVFEFKFDGITFTHTSQSLRNGARNVARKFLEHLGIPAFHRTHREKDHDA